jgi:hypothetical protein
LHPTIATAPFTLRNINHDLEDLGSRFDGAPDLEFRPAPEALELRECDAVWIWPGRIASRIEAGVLYVFGCLGPRAAQSGKRRHFSTLTGMGADGAEISKRVAKPM